MNVNIQARGATCRVLINGHEIKNVTAVFFEQTVEGRIGFVTLRLSAHEGVSIDAEDDHASEVLSPRVCVEREDEPGIIRAVPAELIDRVLRS